MDLVNTTQFIIYGCGEVGTKCYENLKTQGYRVIAAIDKNKYGMNIIDGVMTYKLGNEPEWKEIKKDVAVIICLADGMLHRDAADALYGRGFENIIFLPMNYCIQDSEKRRLTRIYNSLLSGSSKDKKIYIASYQVYFQKDLTVTNSIIREEEKQLIVWMRLEILFTESMELWSGDKTKLHGKEKRKNKPIIYNNTNKKLFEYFDLREQSYEKYFDGYKDNKTEKEKEREVIKREKLYSLYKTEYNKGMDFFIESAPFVVWNPKGYFNLVGGHHRISFLLHKGHTLFPVVMSRLDFEKWCNKDKYRDFLKFINEKGIENYYAPIPHPGLVNLNVENEEYGKTRLEVLIQFCESLNMTQLSVLDCSQDQGYYARNLERLGVYKAVYIDTNRDACVLCEKINELVYRDNVKTYCKDISDIDETFNMVIAMSNYKENNTNLKKVIGVLDKITENYLFWESFEVEEVKMILMNTSFLDYIPLCKNYHNLKIGEMGVFIK